MNHFIKKRVRFTFYGSFYYDDELSRGWNFHMQAATTTCLFAVIYWCEENNAKISVEPKNQLLNNFIG